MADAHRGKTFPQLVGFLSLELFIQLCLRLRESHKFVFVFSKLLGCTLDQLYKTINLVLKWRGACICVFKVDLLLWLWHVVLFYLRVIRSLENGVAYFAIKIFSNVWLPNQAL